MINVKKEVYDALLKNCPGVSISDEWPKEWKKFPKLTFTEENNAVRDWYDNEEQFARLVYKLDVWDKTNTADTAAKADAAMSSLGFMRTMATDSPVQEMYKHKVMRYECIIDIKTQYVFHE